MNEHKTSLAGTSVDWHNATYTVLLTPQESNGAIGVFEGLVAPDSGPPRHIHHNEDETFYIVEGEVTFWVAGETFIRNAGEMAFVPRGTEHTFHVESSHPARMLTIMTPGGFEGFFAEMARDNLRIPEDMPRIVEIAQKFNLEFTGPPLKG